MNMTGDNQITFSENSLLNDFFLSLQPYRFYNCCVSGVNEAGTGIPACQTVLTHEAGEHTV